MSSLRPLITIMLLAAVGVVLYMKINETEPAVPADVPQWSVEPLQIGGAGDGGSGSPPTPASTFEAGDAPAFASSNTANTVGAPAPGDEAPAWTPEPLSLGESPTQGAARTDAGETAAGDAESSPIARSADAAATIPAMPPLPGSETPLAAAADAPATMPIETTPLAGTSSDAPTAGIVETEPLATEAPGTTASAAPDVSDAAAAQAGVAANAAPSAPTTPTPDAPSASPDAAAGTAAKTSVYSSARVAVQAALDRGELSQALLLVSEWYDDPSLTPAESEEVNTLLSQLAGSVIYDGPPSHRLEPAYTVQAGETIADVAGKYNVPAQLLAKINGVAEGAPMQPGQELKVVRGPFTAVIELGKRKMTLMLDRRYAGKFAIDVDPAASIEDGSWRVEQKELTPAVGGLYGQPAGATQERSLLLTSEADAGKTIIIRGPGGGDPAAIQPPGRTIRLKANDVADLYDILSEGSRVTVRR